RSHPAPARPRKRWWLSRPTSSCHVLSKRWVNLIQGWHGERSVLGPFREGRSVGAERVAETVEHRVGDRGQLIELIVSETTEHEVVVQGVVGHRRAPPRLAAGSGDGHPEAAPVALAYLPGDEAPVFHALEMMG